MAQTQSVELNYKWMAFVSIGLLKPASHISSGLALQTTPYPPWWHLYQSRKNPSSDEELSLIYGSLEHNLND